MLLTLAHADAPSKSLRFTSAPDLFNWNISNPQPGWEETIRWFLDRMQQEGLDFHLNAGDIMDARWWDNPEQVKAKTQEYWSGFLKRYADRRMTLYLAPGDHEYGDDQGLKKGDIARAFGNHFGYTVGEEQLAWLDKVLTEQGAADGSKTVEEASGWFGR